MDIKLTLRFALINAIIVACLAVPIRAGEVPSAARTGEIVCTGAVRYQVGGGAWLSRENGTAAVGLPVTIETGAAPCHLVIPKVGNFQANSDSRFVLTECGEGELALVITKGTVLYSLTGGVAVNVTTPVASSLDQALPPQVVGSVWPAFPKGQFSNDPTALALDQAFQFTYTDAPNGATTPAVNAQPGKLRRWFAPVLRRLGLGREEPVILEEPFDGILI